MIASSSSSSEGSVISEEELSEEVPLFRSLMVGAPHPFSSIESRYLCIDPRYTCPYRCVFGASFDDIPVKTMVAIVPFDREINQWHYLGLIRVVAPRDLDPKHIGELPVGTIYSARFNGFTRGLPGKCFKNAVTTAVRTEEKGFEVRVFCRLVHLSGIKRQEDGLSVVENILKHAAEAQRLVELLSQNKTYQEALWDFIPKLRLLDGFWNSPNGDLPDIPQELLDFLLTFLAEYEDIEPFEKQIKWLITCPRIFDQVPKIQGLCLAVVKYNYTLGGPVNLAFLYRYVKVADHNFIPLYINEVDRTMRLILPYKREVKYIKPKETRHIFIITHSGFVTQSGPGGELSAEAYNLFVKLLRTFFDELTTFMIGIGPVRKVSLSAFDSFIKAKRE